MAYPFELPDLGYPHDALEPHIDSRTMEIHHGRHHAAYTANLNAALKGHPELHGKSANELVSDLAALPDGIRTAVRNNGGGYVNHNLFWRLMAPGGAAAPGGMVQPPPPIASSLRPSMPPSVASTTSRPVSPRPPSGASGRAGLGWRPTAAAPSRSSPQRTRTRR